MEKEYNYKIGKKAIHPIAFARGLLAKTDKMVTKTEQAIKSVFGMLILILLMVIGGNSGSTAGEIKICCCS